MRVADCIHEDEFVTHWWASWHEREKSVSSSTSNNTATGIQTNSGAVLEGKMMWSHAM